MRIRDIILTLDPPKALILGVFVHDSAAGRENLGYWEGIMGAQDLELHVSHVGRIFPC